MAVQKNERLAVLIDADNAKSDVVAELLAEISRYGTATIKRAYGDWTTTNLRGWKEVLNQHAIQPIQQFRYTTGKNATDSALIIDAMDLLHTGRLDGFCLVSSDSDFTRLATRVRESGLVAYGIGERHTPVAFVAACDKFIYTEILGSASAAISEATAASHIPALPELQPTLRAAIQATAREDGWASLSAVGGWVNKNNPAFDSRNYQFPKLSGLVRGQPYLEVREVPMGEGANNLHVQVRLKA